LASEIDDDPSILAERAGLKLWQAREISASSRSVWRGALQKRSAM
jgi:hypothetical protein